MLDNTLKIDRCGRHIHLSAADAQQLFYDPYVPKEERQLEIPGQFTVDVRVTVIGRKSKFDNVTIIYPTRKGSYCEMSRTDAIQLGFKPDEVDGMYYSQESEILSSEWGRYVVVEYRGTYLTIPAGIQRPHIHTSSDYYKDNELVTVVIRNETMRLEVTDVLVKKNAGVKGHILHIDNDLVNAIPNANSHIMYRY
jgi:propanediol utilization protein